jgi:hypothetical protein
MMDRSERLESAFVRFADTLVADYDVAELIRPLIDDVRLFDARPQYLNILVFNSAYVGFSCRTTACTLHTALAARSPTRRRFCASRRPGDRADDGRRLVRGRSFVGLSHQALRRRMFFGAPIGVSRRQVSSSSCGTSPGR